MQGVPGACEGLKPRGRALFPLSFAPMVKSRTRTIKNGPTQVTRVTHHTTQGPRTRTVAVRRNPTSSPKHKKSKTSTNTPKPLDNTFFDPDDPFDYAPMQILLDDVEERRTKACAKDPLHRA